MQGDRGIMANSTRDTISLARILAWLDARVSGRRHAPPVGNPAGSIPDGDRAAIFDLYARYCLTVDERDGHGWASCFTPEGVFHSALSGLVYRGYDELVAFFDAPHRRRNTRHWNCNIILNREDEGILGRCYGMLVDYGTNDISVIIHAVYEDYIVRQDGDWRFACRRPRPDRPTSFGDHPVEAPIGTN
jgi:hypothetical protein